MDAHPLAAWTDRLARDPRLDGARSVVGRLSDAVAQGRRGDVLGGSWLGHPLHPVLTDLPVGFWTSAAVLDLGGRRYRPAADALVAAGLASTVPTVASGLVDWRTLSEPGRRVGTLHATVNGVASALYAGSLLLRWRGSRRAGVALGMAGATAASVGGYLGGRLAFEQEVGRADRSEGAPQDDEPSRDDIVDQQGAALAEVADGGGSRPADPGSGAVGPAAEEGIVDQQGAALAELADEGPRADA